MSAGIISTGKYIPSVKISNRIVAKKLKLSEKKIIEKTGINFRFFSNKKETISFMATRSAKQAIKNSKISKEKINLVICWNFEAEYKLPCLAS